MIKRGKKAQFYLAAAIIITIAVFSLAVINNYAKTEQISDIYDLKKELGSESGYVVDFSLYSKTDTSSMIENWTKLYVEGKKSSEIPNWLFVYGIPGDITVMAFTDSSAGKISLDYGSGSSFLDIRATRINKTVVWADYVDITFANFTYNFNMNSGKNFAFIINRQGYTADSRAIE